MLDVSDVHMAASANGTYAFIVFKVSIVSIMEIRTILNREWCRILKLEEL